VYGTVGHLRLVEGQSAQFWDLVLERTRAETFMSGYIASLGFILDRDPHEVIFAVIFISREAYVANAESPEQDARYRQMRELLCAEPLWLDGDVEPFMVNAGGDLSKASYGTVAHMRLLPGKFAEIEALGRLEAAENRTTPGMIGDWIYRLDRDPNEVVMVTVFESRDLYWANAQDPEQDRSYRRLRALLSEDPVWHDGSVVPRLRF
jgi:heme-degrading monooxygenase HmoA